MTYESVEPKLKTLALVYILLLLRFRSQCCYRVNTLPFSMPNLTDSWSPGDILREYIVNIIAVYNSLAKYERKQKHHDYS